MKVGKQLLVDERPLVVATISSEKDLDFLLDHPEEAAGDVWEIRLDSLPAGDERIARISQSGRRPLLFTARDPLEGGAGNLPWETRLGMLEAVGSGAEFVDLELRTLEEHEDARRLAQTFERNEALVVASYHDFEACPSEVELSRLEQRFKEVPAGLLKVAVTVSDLEQVVFLAHWLEGLSVPASVMGMGAQGKLSRLVLARSGSLLNYGYLRTANAPGQWSAAAMSALLPELLESLD
ncbi:MAG: type I 3-dehydroquinate dehydratase [Verrucomicrobiota bacterium]